jgi:hypothetical protein
MALDPALEGGETLLNNFEILEPPKRTATIKGESVDVSIIPARVALKFISFSKKYDMDKLEKMGEDATEDDIDDGMIEDVVGIVGMICQKSNKKINKDWLLDNLEINELMAFTKYVFAGLKKTKAESAGAAGGKN